MSIDPTKLRLGKIKGANPRIIALRNGIITTTSSIITILRIRRHRTAILVITITIHIITTTLHHLFRRLMLGGILVHLDQQQPYP